MDEAKLRKVIEAMEGMTYGEWYKLKHVIDVKFSAEANTVTNKLVLAPADEIVNSYKRLF